MNRLTRLTVLAGLAVAAGLGGCGHRDEPAPTSPLLRRGLGGEPASLDPAGASDNFSIQVVGDLYEGLTVESPAGDALPGVASSWTVDPTGTQYTFHLRPEARWSNGKPVRSQDFVAAWRRVVDPATASPGADDLRLVSGAAAILARRATPDTLGVYAPSDDVLIVNLDLPAAYLPQILSHCSAYPVYSDAAARTHDADQWVSNGPYVLTRWQSGARLELERNRAYWDKTNVHIAAVEYQFAPEEASQLARYRAGQLDLTDTVPANELPALRAGHAGELVIAPWLATAYYGVNFTNESLGKNVALRQALAMAIDRKELTAILGFGQLGAYGFVPQGTWNYDDQRWAWSNDGNDERIAAARRLYAEAGYTKDAPLHLRLIFNSNFVIKRTAILIAAMWKEALGVETALNEEEYRVFLQTRHDKSRWDVARLGWEADFNDASNFLDILRTRSTNNDMGYSNPAFDALLDQAASAVDVGQRKRLLESAERLMLDDYPIIPLYQLVSKRLVKPYVQGLRPTALDHVPTKSLTLLPH